MSVHAFYKFDKLINISIIKGWKPLIFYTKIRFFLSFNHLFVFNMLIICKAASLKMTQDCNVLL